MYDFERYRAEPNRTFEAFRQARSQLSRLTWDAYAQALDCDSGSIAARGVHSAPLDEEMARRFDAVLERSPRAT
ncbi:MAG TPA: hypothetical protein VMI56_13225, partial [Reyranella sp.]|nr:hypothetical protein [Reyranella sp.]